MTEWVKILDWGFTYELWGKGNDRVLVDRGTGKEVLSYTFKK